MALSFGLYGLDNFYYRRSKIQADLSCSVYTDLIISTIVDDTTIIQRIVWSIRT